MKNSFALSAVVFVFLYALVFVAIYITDTMLLPAHAVRDASLIALVFGFSGAFIIGGSFSAAASVEGGMAKHEGASGIPAVWVPCGGFAIFACYMATRAVSTADAVFSVILAVAALSAALFITRMITRE